MAEAVRCVPRESSLWQPGAELQQHSARVGRSIKHKRKLPDRAAFQLSQRPLVLGLISESCHRRLLRLVLLLNRPNVGWCAVCKPQIPLLFGGLLKSLNG